MKHYLLRIFLLACSTTQLICFVDVVSSQLLLENINWEIKNYSSQDSIIITNKDINKNIKPKRGEDAFRILISSSAGLLVGFFSGKSLAKIGYYSFNDGIRGAVIGASILPMVTYEIFKYKRMKYAKKELQKKYSTYFIIDKTNYEFGLYFTIGLNKTYVSEDNFESVNGFVFNISKKWNCFKNFKLLGKVDYMERKFLLLNKKINSYPNDMLFTEDINFFLKFIDVSFLPGFEVPIHQGIKMNLFIGPSFSVPIYNQNRIIIKSKERVNNKTDFSYDYTVDVEAGPVLPYLNYSICSQVLYKKLIIEAQYKKSNHAHEIIKEYVDQFKIKSFSVSFDLKL